ncbi:PREDICTED: TRAF-type zinc finger domain-containing protein 1-like [Branchiostoma belcheri]|uniref:TRAF-type zinc finger domain-containing protein 1-like n=1 Tax=Branchiostoma belcheri TaxID=7741 RepID=A0A6P5AK78_BRABE|nr:PREDICTED: TRAF-type zinc finger domain-containing protein 1-like [Branchiostoma belcheri]
MDEQPETKFCSNCKRDIPAQNFVMHQTHCQRNIVLCEHCKEPVPRSEMEEHFEETHAQVKCKCGMSVEKCKLEEHETDACPLRPAQCQYCEIDLSHKDLASHLDYCGTRTEECFKCHQRIMKKDELQHEASNCKYPEPKPLTKSSSESSVRDLPSHYQYGIFNRYASEFDIPMDSDPFDLEQPIRSVDSDHSLLVRSRGARARLVNQGPTRNRISSDRDVAMPVPRSVAQAKKGPKNKSTNVSAARGRDIPPRRGSQPRRGSGHSDDSDPDWVLARHLAHDLSDQDDHELDTLLPGFDRSSNNNNGVMHTGGLMHSPPQNRAHHITTAVTNGDDAAIPCEFCQDLFPIDILIEHQSGCNPYLSHAPVKYGGNLTSTSTQQPPANQGDNRDRQHAGSGHPSVMDNLGYSSVEDRLRSIPLDPIPVPDDDSAMLPCEFCGTLLPADFLIQHQSVCQMDDLRSEAPTPRPPPQLPPSVAPPVRRHKPSKDQYSDTGPTRRVKRQGDPSASFLSFGESSSTNHRMKPVGPKKNPGGTRPGATTITNHFASLHQEKTSTKSSSNTKTGQVSEPREEAESPELAPRYRANSAARTRKTLESLLQDDNMATSEILERMEEHKRQKGRKGAWGEETEIDLTMDEPKVKTQPKNKPTRRPQQPEPMPGYQASFAMGPGASRSTKVKSTVKSSSRSVPSEEGSGTTNSRRRTDSNGANSRTKAGQSTRRRMRHDEV